MPATKPTTVPAYMAALPDERRKPMAKLRATVRKHLPKGFKEMMNYGMPGWGVPHSRYPDGYHCDPKLPLPFLNIASQKSHIGFYHMGIYADAKLLKWFEREWPKHVETKLDMGKSCIRFKKPDSIPYELLGDLCTRMTPDDWIALYEKQIRR